MKFLYYLGHWHRQYAAPRLRELFQQRGRTTWLIDATVEPGTPMYFGLLDADSRICLDAWKIASENANDLVPCLRAGAERFGTPREVLHDLGDAMAAACDAAWNGAVPHRVCQFHLLRDIGEDLYTGPQTTLRELIRKLKLQSRMKEQRRGQTVWLRDHVEDATALIQLLRGQAADTPDDVLGREMVLAFHQWILDYASDGRRQGFPFDPYTLYFHRRVVRAAASLEQLLGDPAVCQRAPRSSRISPACCGTTSPTGAWSRRPVSSRRHGNCSPACERRCDFRPKAKVPSTIPTCWTRKQGAW